MKNQTISFIGAGNMASSLIGGLLAAGYSASNIWASDPYLEKHQELKDKFGIHLTADNKQAAEQADVLIFAVKPQIFKQAALEIAPLISKKHPLIVSIAAGIPEKSILQWLNFDAAIVRCMPNTPALIQSGATGLYANKKVTAQQKSLAESILRAVGITVWVEDEHHLDTVTALSGSGPAYFFLAMDALEKAAIELGLSKESAHMLTLQTALGAARMALMSEESLEELRKRVTSPGGTTERALQVLQKGEIEALFNQAVKAAHQRSKELAKEII